MSAHTLGTVLDSNVNVGIKTAVIEVTLSASYDSGGSILDLSSVFPSKVYGLEVISTSPHQSSAYKYAFIKGASYSPSLGKIKIHDVTASNAAEVSGDLSARSIVVSVTGK